MIPLRPPDAAGAAEPADGFHDIIASDALADGGQHVTTIGFRRVLICRIGDELHAVADICPHAMQPLAGGQIADCAIRCPKHGARFDLRSGKPLNGVTNQPLPVYAVRVRDGRIEVSLSSKR